MMTATCRGTINGFLELAGLATMLDAGGSKIRIP
jgi:hypothetical protein